MPLLKAIKVTKQYDAVGDIAPTPVLQGIDMSVEGGESVAITGPSGCGKSTLLNIVGTLDRPTSGEVFLEETNLAELDEKQLAGVRSSKIGFVFQSHHLLPQCTVLENVLVPTLTVAGRHTDESPVERAKRLLDRVGLAGRSDYRPGLLSGGERQRVAVVRSLINAPQLILADEPTGALDRATAETLIELLAQLNKEESLTLIVVTHSMHLASQLNRVLELQDGKLVGSGE